MTDKEIIKKYNLDKYQLTFEEKVPDDVTAKEFIDFLQDFAWRYQATVENIDIVAESYSSWDEHIAKILVKYSRPATIKEKQDQIEFYRKKEEDYERQERQRFAELKKKFES